MTNFEKLKISKNTVIHCNTEELADKVLAIFNSCGLVWKISSYLDHNNWSTYKQNTCYNLYKISYCELEYYKNNNYNIITAEEFLKLHNQTVNSKYIVTKEDLIDNLSKFSIKLAQLTYDEVIQQYPNRTIKDLQKDNILGWFRWSKTKQNHNFWSLLAGDIVQFYKDYPEYKPEYTCELDKFPKEVIELMLQRQVEADNKIDKSVFENKINANVEEGGFDWNLSIEGENFWDKIIMNKNFDVFFKKYPKKDWRDRSITNPYNETKIIESSDIIIPRIPPHEEIYPCRGIYRARTVYEQDKYTSMSNNLKINQDEEDKLFN